MSDWKPEVHGEGKHLVAAWSEDFNCFYRFESEEFAKGFARGFGSGGSNYGAGNCFAVAVSAESLTELKDDSPEMHAELTKYLAACGLTVPGL